MEKIVHDGPEIHEKEMFDKAKYWLKHARRPKHEVERLPFEFKKYKGKEGYFLEYDLEKGWMAMDISPFAGKEFSGESDLGSIFIPTKDKKIAEAVAKALPEPYDWKRSQTSKEEVMDTTQLYPSGDLNIVDLFNKVFKEMKKGK